MTLTPEQNATLQLLLERGQSYADLAGLLGGDEASVRARARAALAELGGVDPDHKVVLTDYLLGQADPIGRADAVRHLRDDPDDHRLAAELVETLRTMYPDAALPRLPGEPRAPRRPRRRAATEPAGERRGVSLSTSQTRLIVALGAGALLLVAVVLAVTGAFSGGEDEPSELASGETTSPQATADEGEQIERVALRAKGGGDARGEAIFGIATADQPYVDLTIEGLEPAPRDKTYVVWLMLADNQGYPLSPIAVNPQGDFHDRFAIQSAVLQIVARVQRVNVSIAPVAKVQDTIQAALEDAALVIDKPGRTVLEGDVPVRGGGGQPE